MGKSKDVLYSTALTQAGDLVTTETAEKGEVYVCPICQSEMLLRLGEKKRHHFAHKALTENCTPESVLHYSFKRVLAEHIEKHIQLHEPLQITWHCNECWEEHTGNLVKKAVRVQIEYNLGTCQPDIALLDKNGRVIAVIEVVVTHEPEEKVLDYYDQKGIGVVIFRLKSEADLGRIALSMHPDSVFSCLNPKCKRCGERTNRKDLIIIQSTCKWCQHPMLVAAIDSKGALCGEFRPADLKMAKSKGVRIGYWQSKKSSTYYPTSACPRCNGVIGLSWLWDDHVGHHLDLPRETFRAGYLCRHCEIDLDGAWQVRFKTKPNTSSNA